MNEQIWAELGIAPTHELAAIKKAYALKLRVTRPDDDAAAYQRLRSAYEWAQQWSKWGRDEDEDEVAEVPPAEAEPVEESSVDEPAQEETFASLSSDDLAAWMERLKPQRLNGREQSLQAWREIGPQLLSIPLHLHNEASARFADLVIDESWLPTEIVEALLEHFGWRDDFRAARLLGADRLQRLHEVLDERIERPITDPAVLSHFAPLQHLQRLRAKGLQWAAFWFALRLGDPLLQISLQPDPKLQRQLGMDDEPRPLFGQLLFSAGLLRMALFGLFVLALCLPALTRAPDPSALGLTLSFGVMAFFAGRLLLMVSALICTASWQGLGLERALGQRWSDWRASPGCTHTGLALIALVACGVNFLPDGLPTIVACFVWGFGLLLAWPLVATHGTVALGACVVMTLVVTAVAVPPEVQALLLLCVPLWVLGGCRLYAMGRPVPWLSVFVRPITNSLHLCDRYGYKFAMAPMLAAAAVCMAYGGLNGVTVFVVWSFSILGLGWLQNRLTDRAIQEMG